ncbi:Hydroxyacyl-coenzyme A dehydrogenase, mitochondrial [Eumeta japonica]|uniref:3-hydroxyacyl-CoA dehydrogenase n=1 Tax=Eumeta variegata TaxID=151549 RepID=A0A4C1TVM1_EUMVA|nr:Hydroxyacyl-coenzyme A dehydrogenase, mitochondrial [Eumeta japonica]
MNKLIGFTRKFSSSAALNSVKTVTVVGGGLMGSGIAQVAAQAGQNVTIVDIKPELLDHAQKSIQNNLQRVAKKVHKDDPIKMEQFVKESISRIKITTNVEEAANVDLIVEAIVEKLEPKQELFNKLDKISPEHTIFATNTSSISVNAIGSGIKRKDRFGGLHFFNPVPVMRLLEVIKTESMSEETYKIMMEWGKSVGKTCITCKDTPGFVVNRLLGPYSAEALRLYERGDASKEDIDIGMKLGAGYPMGPFELADYTGLDTNKYVLEVLHKLTNNPVFRPIPLLDKMVSEGKLGVKTGEGFYKYKKYKGEARLARTSTNAFQCCVVLCQSSQANIACEDPYCILVTKSDASAKDIDTAMKLGAGYPMGPLELADFTGLDTKQSVLATLYKETQNPVFGPIALLDKLVAEGKFGRKTGEGIYNYLEKI